MENNAFGAAFFLNFYTLREKKNKDEKKFVASVEGGGGLVCCITTDHLLPIPFVSHVPLFC